jgi:hypothetical protein
VVTASSSDVGQVQGLPEPLDLSHLHESAQQLARLPDPERLRHVRAERWIGYTRAAAALQRLETLYGWPGKQRMPNLLLLSPTNNGKWMIIEKVPAGTSTDLAPGPGGDLVGSELARTCCGATKEGIGQSGRV